MFTTTGTARSTERPVGPWPRTRSGSACRSGHATATNGSRRRRETVMRAAHLADSAVEVQRITFHGSRVQVFEFVEGPQKSVILCSIETDADARFVVRLLPDDAPGSRAR